ncbi:MAG: flagellar hook-basal body protein [Thermoleophilia bacterium]|jgi:flagellar basal-body rod protein FlgG|nr:flagellar hook-basal body protein [Thermoleophilia bacterium]
MIRGLYISATGLLAESRRQDVIANNLANVQTTGFRRSETQTRPFSEMLLHNTGLRGTPAVGTLAMGTEVAGARVIDVQGPITATGNTLDVALSGTGFISVQAEGGRRYTRAGNLGLDAQGRLTTADGAVVEGQSGPIVLGQGAVAIGADGTVSQGGAVRGRIRLVTLDPESIRAEGQSRLTGTERGPATATVRQGFLEGSSVETVSEMVDLIRVMRSFEVNQRAMRAQDETLEQAVTKVGAIG